MLLFELKTILKLMDYLLHVEKKKGWIMFFFFFFFFRLLHTDITKI
jgi:hypothetical protein